MEEGKPRDGYATRQVALGVVCCGVCFFFFFLVLVLRCAGYVAWRGNWMCKMKIGLPAGGCCRSLAQVHNPVCLGRRDIR